MNRIRDKIIYLSENRCRCNKCKENENILQDMQDMQEQDMQDIQEQDMQEQDMQDMQEQDMQEQDMQEQDMQEQDMQDMQEMPVSENICRCDICKTCNRYKSKICKICKSNICNKCNKCDICKRCQKKVCNLLIPKRSEGKPLQYPKPNEITSKTFHIKYEKKLSSIAKLILNSFRNKYIYYAIDDILYLLKSNLVERDNLLAILYSQVLSLQNNLSVNFFDIWIHQIYINEISKVNKFINNDSQNSEQFTYITIKLLYKTRVPIKKPESLW